MSKLIFIALLTFFAWVGAPVNAQESEANTAITLERTACFGTCPIYTVTILQDGTVIYSGERFVEVTGEQRSEIDPKTVALMVKAFEDAGYFEWDETYDTQSVTDLPTITTSVTRDGETHRIVRYAGDSSAPLELAFLEQWIDEMTSTQSWTGVLPDNSFISNGTNTPSVTLRRDACFGTCPIYNIAAFADGTVVYTGIANVDAIGVHVIKTDALSVDSIAQRATSLGYFGWEDRYEHQVMTDQATVITSIQTADQFKRIVRYGGDPNAPVGLVWVEEMIDQLVTDAAS